LEILLKRIYSPKHFWQNYLFLEIINILGFNHFGRQQNSQQPQGSSSSTNYHVGAICSMTTLLISLNFTLSSPFASSKSPNQTQIQ
jgi:hypothetical protein